MKSFRWVGVIAGCLLAVGCSVQNSVSVSDTAERLASVTTPQGEIQTVKTPDGSLCIFMRGANNRLYYKKQNSATGFPTAWSQIAGTSQITGNIATYCSGAYPVYAFSINSSSNLVMTKQTVNNGSWSTWQVIGGTAFQINSEIAVAGDWDGRINVFARKSSDNKLYCLYQNSDGSWSNYNLWNAPVYSKFAVLKHLNFVPTNGLTVFFAVNINNSSEPFQIHALHQYATVGWVYDAMNCDGCPYTFGTGGSLVANNLADGRMMVMGRNGNASILRGCYESTIGIQGGWAQNNFGEGGAYEPLALAKNADGRLEVFFNDYIDPSTYTGHLKHKWQNSSNPEDWSAPELVGNFPTVGYLWNSGLSVFVIGTRIVADRFQNGTLAAFAQTSQFAGNPIGYTYFNCNYPGCWMPGPVSLGNP